MQKTDPYDYAATILPQATRDQIKGFWDHFAAGADALDQAYEAPASDARQMSLDIMAPLDGIADRLAWEFGPAETGHTLCITAEWADELRPLARLMMHMAPDLPRWAFIDARVPIPADVFDKSYMKGRFGRDLSLSYIDVNLDEAGQINLVGHGRGSVEELENQTFAVATSILGEEIERDWIVYCDAEPTKPQGLRNRLLGKSASDRFDVSTFADDVRAQIAQARAQLPDRPYRDIDLDDRSITLFQPKPPRDGHPRHDLLTFASMTDRYGQAVLSYAPFASRRHSNFDEWFVYLRIPRTDITPFDDVEDRGEIEEMLHSQLASDGIGGLVAAGHGTEAVYLDFALQDVPSGLAQISRALSGKPYADQASLHFLDRGLENLVVPVVSGSEQLQ